MQTRSIWKTLKALMTSRKFLIAFVGWVGMAVAFYLREIGIAQFVDATVTLSVALIVSIAAEDTAQKLGPQ